MNCCCKYCVMKCTVAYVIFFNYCIQPNKLTVCITFSNSKPSFENSVDLENVSILILKSHQWINWKSEIHTV